MTIQSNWLNAFALIAIGNMLFHTALADQYKSGEQQTILLELFTSEGCSSCPPAEHWLNSFTDKEGLWQIFIPMAFHVDYWDYIGWKDQFALSAHTSRQRKLAAEQAMSTIYTPGFFLNGDEWRGWFLRRFLSFPTTPKVGVLTANADKEHLAVVFSPNDKALSNLHVNIAVLGFGFKTKVKAGENKGVTLTHDFVVLGTNKAPLLASKQGFSGTVGWPMVSQPAKQYAISVWVSEKKATRPLQATGGWLPHPPSFTQDERMP